VLKTLREHLLKGYASMTNDDIGRDLLMHRLVLGCDIRNLVAEGRVNSIEMTALRRRGVSSVRDGLLYGGDCMQLLHRVVMQQLQRQIVHLHVTYRGRELPEPEGESHIYNQTAKQWHRLIQLSSRQIRMLLWGVNTWSTLKCYD
jgi:hypothetical protein